MVDYSDRCCETCGSPLIGREGKKSCSGRCRAALSRRKRAQAQEERERRIQGCSMGSNRFRTDMPRYIEFYRQGRLKLDQLVSQRLKLEQVNKAFEDMLQGDVARSVITFS